MRASGSRPRPRGSLVALPGSRDAEVARRCPASCSGRSTPVRSTRWPRACPTGRWSSPRRTGRPRRRRCWRRSSGRSHTLAWNSSGANLASGIASTLLARGRRRARTPRGRRVRAAGGAAPRPASRRPPRQPLSRSARPLRRAGAHRGALASRYRRPPGRRPSSSSTPTIRWSGPWPGTRDPRCASGWTTPAMRDQALQHAADSKYCVRCGAPYVYVAAYVGHLGDYRCERLRPRPTGSGRRCERDRARRARRVSLHTRDTGRRARRSSLGLPGLYNVYNAVGGGRAGTRGRDPAGRDRRRTPGLRGRVRALRADRDGRSPDPDAPDQEPRRRQRGHAHPPRRRRAGRPRRRAQRRDRRRSRRLVDLGRRLRAAARAGCARRRERASGLQSSPCASPTAGSRSRGSSSSPTSRKRSTAAWSSPGQEVSSPSSRPTPRCSSSARSPPAEG